MMIYALIVMITRLIIDKYLNNRKLQKGKIMYCVICGKRIGYFGFVKFCSEDCQRAGARLRWKKYARKNRETRYKYFKKYYGINKLNIIKRVLKNRGLKCYNKLKMKK